MGTSVSWVAVEADQDTRTARAVDSIGASCLTIFGGFGDAMAALGRRGEGEAGRVGGIRGGGG
jgi:hypothetical protein